MDEHESHICNIKFLPNGVSERQIVVLPPKNFSSSIGKNDIQD